jgi:ribosomal protein S18 acetylase RimI-like enzyme
VAVDLEVDVEHERAERLYECRGFTRLPRSR